MKHTTLISHPSQVGYVPGQVSHDMTLVSISHHLPQFVVAPLEVRHLCYLGTLEIKAFTSWQK